MSSTFVSHGKAENIGDEKVGVIGRGKREAGEGGREGGR